MVRKNQLEPIGDAAKLIAKGIKTIAQRGNLSQETIAAKMRRSQSYISQRMIGDKAWDLDEIEKLSKLLGYSSPYTLLEEARAIAENTRFQADSDQIMRNITQGMYRLAASHDPNKEREKTEDYN